LIGRNAGNMLGIASITFAPMEYRRGWAIRIGGN